MAFRNQWVWVLGLMVAMVGLSQGCSSKPEMAERNVTVSLDDSLLRATSVEVNLIGANDSDFARVGTQFERVARRPARTTRRMRGPQSHCYCLRAN